MFEWRLQQLASGASLKVAELKSTHAILRFSMNSGLTQNVFIVPYDEVWEFSVQSAIQFYNPAEFPQVLLAALLVQNTKNKRAFWCIEQLNGKYVLSGMLNFPADNLTPVEFDRICRALVTEVDKLETAFLRR